jgi:5-methylcytosine-specific restriction endonuclease McrA
LPIRYCKSCGHEFEQQARFCSNCGTRRPTSPLTKAEPAPTFTPEEILASLEEEKGEQEQVAEAPRIEKPEPVREAVGVPPPPPAADPIPSPPQQRAVEKGPIVLLIIGLIIGLPLATMSSGGGLGAGALAAVFAVVVSVRLVQWDRRHRERLRSAAVPTASVPTSQQPEGAATVRTPEADVPVPPPPAPETLSPSPQEQAESGPEARKREDMRYAVGGGLLVGLASAFFGFVVGAPWWGVLPVAGFLGLAFWGHIIEERPKRRGERGPLRNSSVGTATVRSRSIPQWVKIAVATRDGGTCRRCGSNYDLQYDHIIPFSRGGSSTDVNNIQLLCGKCNRRKSNRYIG